MSHKKKYSKSNYTKQVNKQDSWQLMLSIGACRAVWDLTMPHLICNCGKRILSVPCTLYVLLCTHMLYAADYVSLRPVLLIWVRMIGNNPGNARVCPGLQAPMMLSYNQCTVHACDWCTLILVLDQPYKLWGSVVGPPQGIISDVSSNKTSCANKLL